MATFNMNYTNKLQKKNFEPDMMYSLKKRSTNNNRKRQQFRKRSVSPRESERNRSPLKSPNYVSQIFTYILSFEVPMLTHRAIFDWYKIYGKVFFVIEHIAKDYRGYWECQSKSEIWRIKKE